MFELLFYTLDNGTVPVEEFLDSLEPKMRVKAVRSLQLLEEFGNQLREPHSKHITDGIFEHRIKFSNDIARIFYFFIINQQIVVTNGFVKKTQKTPQSQIDLAKEYKSNFERRHPQ